MKEKVQYDSYWNPAPAWCLSHDAVGELLAGAVLSLTIGTPAGFWLDLPVEIDQRVEEQAGFERGTLMRHSLCGYIYVPRTEALSNVLRERGIYGSGSGSHNNYHLQMLTDGTLLVKYAHIIGGWKCSQIEPAQLDALIGQLALTMPQLVTKALAKKGARIEVKARAKASLADELALLSVEDGQINLPSAPLQQYATIKRLIEQAGGAYRTGGAFVFEDGFDPNDVLQRLQGGEKINVQQSTQFFATPPALALDVCAAAVDGDIGATMVVPDPQMLAGQRVLEPEAGDGALADVARAMGAEEVVCVENWSVNAARLRAKGHHVLERDFLTTSPDELGMFSVILANPPFTRGTDIQHVTHMLRFLAPGGVLSVVMSPSWVEGTQRSHAEFRKLLSSYDVAMVDVPAGTFRSSGTEVATVRLVIRSEAAKKPLASEHRQYDLLVA